MLFKSDRDFFAFLLGFLISVSVGTLSQCVEISTGLSLVTFSGVFIALLKYFNEKKKDAGGEIINLVSFFRKEALFAHEDFARIVREELKDENHNFLRLSFEYPTIKNLLDKHGGRANQQFLYLTKTRKIHTAVINLLNILEEFSLRVKLLDATERQEIGLIKHTFITAVEDSVTELVNQRQFGTGNDAFQNTVNLYLKWVGQIDNRSPEERMADYKEKLKG